jgi:ATP-dependent Clp protease ATP-binding subunit ClpA
MTDTGSRETGARDVERVVGQAQDQARRLGHRRVGTEHLLLGLLVDEDADTTGLLRAAGCTLMSAQQMVAELVPVPNGAGRDEQGSAGDVTPRAERAIGRAGRFARQERATEVRARHLLLGVLDVEGLACQVLRRLGVDLAGLRRDAERPTTDAPAGTQPPVTAPPVTASPVTASTVTAPRVTAPPVAASPITASTGPRCPGCGNALAGSLAVTTLDADGGEPGGRRVRVAHCTACGVAIGTVT